MAKNLYKRALILALLLISELFLFPEPVRADIDRNGFRPTFNLTHGQISCATTATLAIAASSATRSWMLSNNSGVDVYVGSVSVTTANGFLLKSGQAISDDGLHVYEGPVYCIVATGTATITKFMGVW